MAEELEKAHLYYDNINKIKVIDNSVLKETEDLKDTCKDYDISVYLNIFYSLFFGYQEYYAFISIK